MEGTAAHSTPHVANWVNLLAEALPPSPVSEFLEEREAAIFSFLVTALLAFFAVRISRKLKMIPGRAQAAAEQIVEAIDGLVCGIMGPRGRTYTPFVGSLFLYIVVTNLYGLIPLQNSSTGYLTTTAPLAISVFFYVQAVAIARNGFFGYLYHLAGSPKSVVEWIFVPLNFPLHLMGEFTKPISLMFRLYGNVMAGHVLVAVFLQIGVEVMRPMPIPIGAPLHLPFLFLEILIGVIQAFVFALLSTVYISVMLPHDPAAHSGGSAERAAGHEAHAHG